MKNTRKGFTLVELLVVIAILAILATVSVVGYVTYINNANESLAVQELTQVKSSILAEDITNDNFTITNGVVNAEGEAAFGTYLTGLAENLNGNLAYADGKVTYTHKKNTDLVFVLDLKTGKVEKATTPVTPAHVCEHKCTVDGCGKCTDATCEETVCSEKCPTHPAPHACEHKCETCGKCTDATCEETVCSEKCPTHPAPHVCSAWTTATCTEAPKCTDPDCGKVKEGSTALGHDYSNGTGNCNRSGCTETMTLYLVPNTNWKVDNARYAAYFFGNGNEAWVSMTDSDSDGVYEVKVPSGSWTNVIFCRMNPSNSTNGWPQKWNQTADLSIPTTATGNICYRIPTGDVWDDSDNTNWGTNN